MEKIDLSDKQRKVVQMRVMNDGVQNLRSIVSEQESRNLIGFTGEAMFHSFCKQATPTPHNKDHDFILQDRRIDIKSRGSDIRPEPDWDCKIPAYSVERQHCDIYVFAIVRKDGSGGYLLGWLPKEEFLKRAKLVKSDEVLQGYVAGRIHLVDLYVVQIRDLHDMGGLKGGKTEEGSNNG